MVRRSHQGCNFIKKETLAQVFSSEFCEISKNTFVTDHLRTAVSEWFYYLLTGNKLFMKKENDWNHPSKLIYYVRSYQMSQKEKF